ncbi:MAG: hypothetical protein IBX69_03380 [Anaerolineales bacterium]|nr:hypothetical protein [Anaerolineales bacterium]
MLKWNLLIGLFVTAILVSACASASESIDRSQELFTYCLRIAQNGGSNTTDQELQDAISYCLEVKKHQDLNGFTHDGGGITGNLQRDTFFETYEVHPLFIEFYEILGGEKLLGPAITPLFQSGEQMVQFVRAGLMEYEPGAVKSDRYRLAPLGLEIGIKEPPKAEPEIPGTRFIAGQVIYHEFLRLYEELGGARIVGSPLTGIRHNTEMDRIEQYFENLGFFRMDLDDPGAVQLLYYGTFACDQNCRAKSPQANILSPEAQLPEPFASSVARLGISFLGRNHTPQYTAPDGQQQVIFDNLVLVVDPDDPERVVPRSIIEMFDVEPHPPVKCLDDPLVTCFKTEGDNGYNIPWIFVEYLQEYGGLSFSGPPITSMTPLENGLYRQCFTNLCIDFDLNTIDVSRIRLAPMGREYLQRYFTLDKPEGFVATQTLEHVRIEVWESGTYISKDESQQISAAILDSSTPLTNREPTLAVTMPDGSQRLYNFPPTNESGITQLSLPPIQAPNGTLIAYQVCLESVTRVEKCVTDHFLIWNYP